MANETIIKVKFPKAVLGSKEHYFGSLAAIYDVLTSEQVGCKLHSLWDHGITTDHPKKTGKCTISKHILHRKSKRNK